jgi:hypothetical protein
MPTAFTVLSGRLTLDTAPWQNALRQAQPALAQFVQNMGQALEGLRVGMRNVATALAGVTPTLLDLTAAGAKIGSVFEKSLAGVRESVQAATGDFKLLKTQAEGSWSANDPTPMAAITPATVAPAAIAPAASDPAATLGADGVLAGAVSLSQVQPSAAPYMGGPVSSNTLLAFGSAILAQFQMAGELEVKLRDTALAGAQQVQQAFQDLVGEIKLGDAGLAELKAAADAAAGKARQLGADLDQLDQVERKNAFHAAGKLTPEEQVQQVAQAQQQQQALGQVVGRFAQEGSKLLGQAFGGTEQVAQLAAQAKATGDPKAALSLLIQNVQARAQMAAINLGTLGTSPALGNFRPAPGNQNTAWLMQNSSAGQFLQSLLTELASLEQQLGALAAPPKPRVFPGAQHVPHMATGGIVQRPTVALVGEEGPEAVLPLANLWNIMQGVVGHSTSSLAAFFQQAQAFANNTGNTTWLRQMAAIQDQALAAITSYQQHSQIDLQPVRGRRVRDNLNLAGNLVGRGWVESSDEPAAAGGHTFNTTLVINSADLTTPAGSRQVAQQLFDHLDAVAKQKGVDMSGGSRMRGSPNVGGTYAGSPTGYAR